MGTISLSLHKKYLKKTEESASKCAQERFEDAEDELYYEDLEADFDELGIDEDGKVLITASIGELGWMTVTLQPTAEELLPLVELAVKRLNKFKTLLESLK